MSPSESRDHGGLDFDAVYVEFQPKIRRYLDRLVGPEAEDVTQEVFAKVSQALPGFRGESSLATWVYRIATNAAYDRLRSSSFRRPDEISIDTDAPAAEVSDRSPGMEQTLVRREMNDCIDAFIARLPPDYRSAVILSEHEGLTDREIAEALQVTVSTVKIRLHRARARLKKELGDGCSFYRDDRNEMACEPKPGVYPLRTNLRLHGRKGGTSRESRQSKD